MRDDGEALRVEDRECVVDVSTERGIHILRGELGPALPVETPVGEVADNLQSSVFLVSCLNESLLSNLTELFDNIRIFRLIPGTVGQFRPVTAVLVGKYN